MGHPAPSAHFELYALRAGRWVMDACFAEETEARASVERTRRSPEVRGVRLVREVSLVENREPLVTVLYDSTQDPEPLVFKVVEPVAKAKGPMPPPRQAARAAAGPRLHLEDDGVDALPARTAPVPWVTYAIGVSGFATALAVGLLAFGGH